MSQIKTVFARATCYTYLRHISMYTVHLVHAPSKSLDIDKHILTHAFLSTHVVNMLTGVYTNTHTYIHTYNYIYIYAHIVVVLVYVWLYPWIVCMHVCVYELVYACNCATCVQNLGMYAQAYLQADV